MEIKIKKLSDNATLPLRGSRFAAGYDLYGANIDTITINPHETVKIPTDLSMEIPEGYYGGVYARSGLATKSGLRPANCVGIIDADYRGNIIVALHNDTDFIRIIAPKERIAQIIISPFLEVNFTESEELSDTERGEGGFGSSGNK